MSLFETCQLNVVYPINTRDKLKNQAKRWAKEVKPQRIWKQNGILPETSCEQSNVLGDKMLLKDSSGVFLH